VKWDDPIRVATGDAHAGPWRMNDSRFHYVDDPTVALQPGGGAAVAWVDNRDQNVFFQAYGADGQPKLPEPVHVSGTPGVFSWLPRVVTSEGGQHVYVLWQEIVFSGGTHGGEAFFAHSDDGGRTFSKPLNLSNTTAGCGKGRLTEEHWHNGSLDLAMMPEGTLLATWTEYQGPLRLSRSTDGGDSFSEPIHVAGSDDRPARGPSLAVGTDGTVHLAWTVGEQPDADIHLAHSDDDGRSFGSAQTLHETEGHSDAPKIAAGPDGSLHVAYAESPEGPFRDYHVRYAKRPRGQRSFDEPKRLSQAEGSPRSAGFPHLALDDRGHVYLLWEQYPDFRKRPRGLAFTRSTDGGETFAQPETVPGTDDPALGINGSLQGLLMRKLDVEEGRIAVINSRFRRDEQSRIRLFLGHAE
jgi:hypothetical protein